jgi:hypothetical protein
VDERLRLDLLLLRRFAPLYLLIGLIVSVILVLLGTGGDLVTSLVSCVVIVFGLYGAIVILIAFIRLLFRICGSRSGRKIVVDPMGIIDNAEPLLTFNDIGEIRLWRSKSGVARMRVLLKSNEIRIFVVPSDVAIDRLVEVLCGGTNVVRTGI